MIKPLIIQALMVLSPALGWADENVSGETETAAEGADNSVATEMAIRLKRAKSCENKIWPDLKMGKYPMYVVDQANPGKPVVSEVDSNTGEVRPANEKALSFITSQGTNGFYLGVPGAANTGSAVSINMPNRNPPAGSGSGGGGKPRMCLEQNKTYMSLLNTASTGESDPVSGSLSLLAHESFHGVDQSNKHTCSAGDGHDWAGTGKAMNRVISGDASVQSDVAYMRANMTHFLKAALENPQQKMQHIRDAVLWYRRMKEKYPKAVEELRDVDRIEGTASYVGFMTAAAGKHGCDNPGPLKKTFLDLATSKMNTIPQPVDLQSYGLGAAAGFVLDEFGDTTWKREVEKGKSPLEILSARFGSMPKTSPKVVDTILSAKSTYDKLNTCTMQETLKPVEAAYENPEDYVAISVPINGAYNNRGVAYVTQGGEWQSVSNKSKELTIDNWPKQPVSAAKSPCPSSEQGQMVVLVPRSSLQQNGSTAEINHQGTYGSVTGEIEMTNAKSFGPFEMYCSR